MLIGKQLGPFTIDKELGSGAMGAVYRAKYVKTGAFVAIKVMAPGVGTTNEQAMARFEREASILKQLKHPNIVRLFATGRYHGQPFYAMEYIEGESLDHSMARRGRLTWEEVAKLGIDLCDALQHAHDKGIVHRDLKPSNLMVLRDDTIKLTDFGIAKDLDMTGLTSAHCTVGTAAYMSPEQCKGERNLTFKSDLYSLGIVLYELATGRKPFNAETPMDMFLKHCNGTFERPSRVVLDMPVWMDTLICQLMEKRPELRPMSASMVASVLMQILEKVTSQKSAGVDAVEKRRADRTPFDPVQPDEKDKEAAQALKLALGKVKKRRKKLSPFFHRKWVRACGLIGALCLVAGVIYWALQPPSQEKLYGRIETMMTSSDENDRYSARWHLIPEYMKYYGEREGTLTNDVQQWKDDYDIKWWENFLTGESSTKSKDRVTRIAQTAVECENNDKYTEARKDWDELTTDNEAKLDTAQGLSVYARKRLKDMDEADAEQDRIRNLLSESGDAEPDLGKLPDELEREAANLVWKADKKDSDLRELQDKWDEFKEKAKGKRLWLLIASMNKESVKKKLAKDKNKEAGSASGQ